jgi:hypothetical protein
MSIDDQVDRDYVAFEEYKTLMDSGDDKAENHRKAYRIFEENPGIINYLSFVQAGGDYGIIAADVGIEEANKFREEIMKYVDQWGTPEKATNDLNISRLSAEIMGRRRAVSE